MRTTRLVALFVGLAFVPVAPGAAQVAPASPQFVAPGSPAGFGIFLADPHPGGGIGVFGMYRASPAPAGVSFRAGIAEGFDDDLAGFGSFELSGFLYRHTQDFPLDVIWVSGGGLAVGDHVWVSIPLGVSLGRELESEGIWLLPYVSPRVLLDGFLGRDRPRPRRNLHLNFAVDLGLDIAFSRALAIRFGASIGDHEALAIGLSFPY